MKDEKSVSDVFRTRLRETRIDRNMSQDALAQAMQRAGYSMDKAAVLRIEKGQRGISLDEAFAFASVLSAVPVQLFTPPGEELVRLTKTTAVNGSGMRAWLRYGDAFIADSGDVPDELVRDRVMQAIAIHARAYLDAIRNEDKEGRREALFAMSRTLEAERKRRGQAERKREDS